MSIRLDLDLELRYVGDQLCNRHGRSLPVARGHLVPARDRVNDLSHVAIDTQFTRFFVDCDPKVVLSLLLGLFLFLLFLPDCCLRTR